MAYTALGQAYAAQGKIEPAHECFGQGIAILREVGNRFELGRSLWRYGQFLHQQGERGATEYLSEARTIFEELGARGGAGQDNNEFRIKRIPGWAKVSRPSPPHPRSGDLGYQGEGERR